MMLKSLIIGFVFLSSTHSVMAFDQCLEMPEEVCYVLNGHYEAEFGTCCLAQEKKENKRFVPEVCELSLNAHKCVLNGGHQIDLLCCYEY